MLILLISDLHLTGENGTFEDVWHGPSAALTRLGDQKFEAIVVSGDLSQQADAGEYDKLRTFANTKLKPLLVESAKRRIIFVPGNHDVCWKTPIGDPVPLATLRTGKPKRSVGDVLREAYRQPVRKSLRYSIDDAGKAVVTEIVPAKYRKRMENVQNFLREFYDREIEAPNRLFDLIHVDDAEHWSAHLFTDQGVAIYGFSSCHRNDQQWTGASISTKAIERARLHAEEHARHLLRVAVWHHGLIAEQGQPDYLTLETLGTLYNAGFRVGMHGHTHKAATDTLDRFFTDQFLVVGTGSLGAGSKDRPDAVGNQFSIVRLNPRQVDVEVFSREGGTGQYSPQPRRFYPLGLGRSHDAAPTTASEHRRKWTVDAEIGRAIVSVQFSKLRLRAPVPVAVLAPPFGGVNASTTVTAANATLQVNQDRLEDGRRRFVLNGPIQEYEDVRWQYEVSNAFALDRTDLASMRERGSWMPTLRDGEEGRPHTVRVHCERLKIEFVFESQEDVVEQGSWHVIVEQRSDHHGAERWNPVPEEQKRCKIDGGPRHIEFCVESPILGLRYTPVFRLARPGVARDAHATRCAHNVLERSFTEAVLPGGSPTLAESLTRQIEPELQRAILDTESVDDDWLGQKAEWIALIWDDRRRLLLPAFGRFPRQSWNIRFNAGIGVAGHAFRFGFAAAWHQVHGKDSLVYVPSGEVGIMFEREYDWIVALPILSTAGQAAVGVVSFAGTEHQTPAASKLYALAEDIVGNRISAVERANNLQNIIAAQFWRAISKHTDLPQADRRTAEEILRRLSPPRQRRAKKRARRADDGSARSGSSKRTSLPRQR